MRAVLVFLMLLLLQACFFMRSPKKRLNDVKRINGVDAVIVPGLPLKEGRWDTLLQARILWSEFLIRQKYTGVIVYSGNAVYTPWIESIGMALYAKELGVSPEKIFIDTLAEHSSENLYYGYRLAKEKGFKKIGLASDPVQCAMLNKFARKNFKEKIYFLPIVYDSIRPSLHKVITIDTSVARKKNFTSLKDREGYRKRLKGTRGKNIHD